jgi:hypothetical protein
MILGTSDWAGKGMLGDELEDLRLDLSGFNTDVGLGREGECKGDVRGKGTAMRDSSVEEEPSSSSKWKVGRFGVRCGRAPRETNGPALCSEWNIVGAHFQNQSSYVRIRRPYRADLSSLSHSTWLHLM